MNEEEKQAIEYLERHILPYCREGNIKFMLNDVILNLIKKQQNKIEDLKKEKSILIEKYTEVVYECGKRNEEIERLKNFNKATYIRKDTIRKKLKEIENSDTISFIGIFNFLKEILGE